MISVYSAATGSAPWPCKAGRVDCPLTGCGNTGGNCLWGTEGGEMSIFIHIFLTGQSKVGAQFPFRHKKYSDNGEV